VPGGGRSRVRPSEWNIADARIPMQEKSAKIFKIVLYVSYRTECTLCKGIHRVNGIIDNSPSSGLALINDSITETAFYPFI
jgi:hypothetical protein